VTRLGLNMRGVAFIAILQYSCASVCNTTTAHKCGVFEGCPSELGPTDCVSGACRCQAEYCLLGGTCTRTGIVRGPWGSAHLTFTYDGLDISNRVVDAYWPVANENTSVLPNSFRLIGYAHGVCLASSLRSMHLAYRFAS
jgi:hypothetical protein